MAVTPAEIERLVAQAIADEMMHGVRAPVLPAQESRGDVAALIDHTLLKPEASESNIVALCREAVEYGFATVCVNPRWVSTCVTAVRGSAVTVCTVVGFPLGASVSDVKVVETQRAMSDGAREVDMVIDLGALKSGRLEQVARDVESVTTACRRAGVLSKVIIEAALLTDEEKIAACAIAKASGADYVKTSTGFGPGGATAADVALMRRVVGTGLGAKAAGGIRDLATVRAMIAAGATRIGTSAGVRIVQESRGESVIDARGEY